MSLHSLLDNMSGGSFALSLRLQPPAPRCLQIAASLLDLPTLADLLQQLPLHQRLDLEPELFQVRCHFSSHNFLHGSLRSHCLSTSSCCCLFPTQPPTLEGPPTSTFTPKQEAAGVPETDRRVSAFKAPSAPFQSLSLQSRAPAAKSPAAAVPGPLAASDATGPSLLAEHHDDDNDDELLDQLLGLGQPVSAASGCQTVRSADQSVSVPVEGECWIGDVRQSVRINPASDCVWGRSSLPLAQWQ